MSYTLISEYKPNGLWKMLYGDARPRMIDKIEWNLDYVMGKVQEVLDAGSGGTIFTPTNGLRLDGTLLKIGGSLVEDTTVGTSTYTLTLGSINHGLTITPTYVNLASVGEFRLKGIPPSDPTNMFFRGDLTWAEIAAGNGGTYDLASPSTVTIGGMPAGTVMTGRTWQSLIEEMTVDFLPPTFSSFSFAGSTLIEVGTTMGGSKTFSWSTTNPSNIAPNSLQIRDVTGSTLLVTGLANDGSEVVNTGSITNTSPTSRQWRIEGQDTAVQTFISSNATISSVYPYFYGKVASGGAPPGDSRPTANQSLINSGTKVVASSTGTITVNFSSDSDEYIWFAIPTTSTSKATWFVSALNTGSIGGSVSPGGNLFPAFDSVSINSPTALWSGVTYKIYISNYQSASSSNMELRNT